VVTIVVANFDTSNPLLGVFSNRDFTFI